MKKSYEKPVLVKRAGLSQVTAVLVRPVTLFLP